MFGDTHGHLRLMFRLCRLWQIQHRVFLDGILQCGDLGYFPNPENVDKATRRFARNDPEELGFRYFTRPAPQARDARLEELLLGQESGYGNVRCPVYFCHGNHEDFQSLSLAVDGADCMAVDCFDRLMWLRPGYVHQLDGLAIAALGGGAESLDTPDDDYGVDEPWKWVGSKACRELAGKDVDLLISHVAPMGVGGASDRHGSRRLRRVVERMQPSYHFYAHHKDPLSPVQIGATKCFWLNDVNFSRQGKGIRMPLEPGCMGILTWIDRARHDFQVVTDKWFAQVVFLNWQQDLLP